MMVMRRQACIGASMGKTEYSIVALLGIGAGFGLKASHRTAFVVLAYIIMASAESWKVRKRGQRHCT